MGLGFGGCGGSLDVSKRKSKDNAEAQSAQRIRGEEMSSGITRCYHKFGLEFGFEFGPAGVEVVDGFLGLFEFDAGSVELGGVATDFGVVQRG